MLSVLVMDDRILRILGRGKGGLYFLFVEWDTSMMERNGARRHQRHNINKQERREVHMVNFFMSKESESNLNTLHQGKKWKRQGCRICCVVLPWPESRKTSVPTLPQTPTAIDSSLPSYSSPSSPILITPSLPLGKPFPLTSISNDNIAHSDQPNLIFPSALKEFNFYWL